MAINKNSNGFTFLFSIIMVVLVGAILGFVSMSLKDLQKKNLADKKMMDVLSSIGVESTRKNAAELFSTYVVERVAVDFEGTEVMNESGGVDPFNKKDPFNIDVKKDYKNEVKKTVKANKGKPAESLATDLKALGLNYPVYNCSKNDSTFYVVPVVGTGLWGPIWGYVAINSDYTTIYGATFDHKGETPGLGAEIKEDFFTVQFEQDKTINYGGNKTFEVVKAGQPVDEHKVNGITGGTITSVGVGEMLDRTLRIYGKYFDKK